MSTGLYTAVSGAAARSHEVETVANNLANVDTVGFKKDQPAFKEYLATVEREHDAVDIPRGPIKDKEFYPLDGKDQSYVLVNGTYTSFKPGAIRVTNQALDVALDGDGFFEVSTPNGIRYTRQGSFKMAQDGLLVTSEGYPVLSAQPGGLARSLAGVEAQPGQGGPSTQGGVVAGRFINLREAKGPVSITSNGEVYSGGDMLGKISVVDFQDRLKLMKQGSTLFTAAAPTEVFAPRATQIKQGMLETSNVNPVEEMTNLIKANRMFEHDMKVMKTYGELLGKEANDIGKL